jgi:NitT/TauT family transport system substrate-binding protein
MITWGKFKPSDIRGKIAPDGTFHQPRRSHQQLYGQLLGAERLLQPLQDHHESIIRKDSVITMFCGSSFVQKSIVLGLALGLLGAASQSMAAETIKLGTAKLTATGPIYIAQAKGYFAAEGLNVDVNYVETAQAISVAVTSGAVDIGDSAFSAAFFSLAGQGALKLIGGQARDVPGFKTFAAITSNKAYNAGLKTFDDLGGHVLGNTQVGSAFQYIFGLIAAKCGIDPQSLHFLPPLQSMPNVLTAVRGNQADAAIVTGFLAGPAVGRGDVHLLGWTGAEVSYQAGGLYISAKTADTRRPMVDAFLRAFRKGSQDYHDAFTGADETRQDQPTADAIAAIIAQNIGQSIADVKRTVSYDDPQARLNVQDVLRQAEWYKSQGMVKPDIDGQRAIDSRYVIPLPPS